MKIRLLGLLAAIVTTVAAAQTYNIFSPGPSGPVKSNGTYALQAEVSTDVANLFTGCSATVPLLTRLGTCDATITPILTGDWIFSPSSGVGVTINAAASQHGLVVSGTNNVSSNSYAVQINAGTGTAGHQSGLAITAGTNSSDAALQILNAAASSNYLTLFGDGGAVLNNATGGDKGIGTINASQLFVNGVAVGTGTGSVASITQAAGITMTPNPLTTTGTVAVDQTFSPLWTGLHTFQGGNVRSVTNSGVLPGETSALPALEFVNASQGVDQKDWEVISATSPARLSFRAMSDNFTTTSEFLVAQRGATGNAVTQMTFGNSTDQPAYSFGGVTTSLNMNGTTPTFNLGGSTVNGGFALLQQYRAGPGGTDLGFYHSRSGTINTNTILNASDETGAISFFGSDGTTTPVRTARIVSFVDGTPSAGTSYPGSLAFYTTPSGSTSIAQRMSISNQGNVVISTPNSGDPLTVNSTNGKGIAVLSPAANSAYVQIAGNGAVLGTNDFVVLQDAANIARLFNRANAGMDFSTNSTQRMSIAASGLVTANNGIQATGSRPSQNSAIGQVLLGADSSIAQITMISAGAAADQKAWDLLVDSSGVLHGRAINDAINSANDWLTVSRSGITPTTINFPLGTLQSGGVAVCLANGTNCGASAAIGSIVIQLTSGGTGAPSLFNSRNCTSPSVGRNSAGSYNLNCSNISALGTNMGLCSIDSSSGGPFTLTVSVGTGTVLVNTFQTTTGGLVDPASGAHIRCTVGN